MHRVAKTIRKTFAPLILFTFIFQQLGFAQVAGQINISGFMQGAGGAVSATDKFRPLHMRYFSYDASTDDFSLILDKGDLEKETDQELEGKSEELLRYFLIGITLPDSAFWVNLRPDAAQQIIDPDLSRTDVGKILLEADLQLKKDTANLTSPETPEGKDYWNKLYKKAGEIFGTENVTIPTLTRPWIVPGEVIIRQTDNSAFIYKASLKVMLEQDHLKDSAVYNFKDERMKQLNDYASEIIRETILPRLTKEVNISKKYAPLRQVFYSIVLARWFKANFAGKPGVYPELIDRKNLTGLTSKENWSVDTYFEAYRKSFNDGEYNIKEPVFTFSGQSIRSYFSGGIAFGAQDLKVSSSPVHSGVGGFMGRDNRPLHPAYLYIAGHVAGPRPDEFKRHDPVVVGTEPYLMPQLERNLIKFVGNPHAVKKFTKAELQEVARKLKVADADLAIILAEVDADTHIPITVHVRNEHVDIATGIVAKAKHRYNPELKDQLREFLGLSASSPVIDLQQYRGKGVNVVDLWKQSGLPVDVFADAIATASYPEQGPCYPASLYPAIKEIYVPTDEVDLKSPLLRKSSRDILHQELTEFLNKQSSPAAASPVLTETAAITEAAILQLLPQGQGQFALNLRELATYLGVTDYAQLCIDLAGIGRSSTKLFVAVKTNSADSNYQDVYVSPNLIPQAEGMMIVLKDGEPAMVEDSRARLENALRAKLGLPLKARIALKVPTVVQEKLRISDFQVDMWYSVFGEGGVLQAKGATVEELARFFARIDTQMPAWHVVVSDGKFRITAVIKATAMIKQGIARQGEAARINSHLTDLRKMESVLHRAGRVSSPVPSGELGGIDFRTMNLMIQPLGNFSSLDFRLPQSPNFAAIDLDKEQEDLNKMLEAGIIPSGERLKEYLAACYYRNEIDVRTRNFLTCLIEVCRLEEEHVVEATPELKEAIVIADSGKFISN